MKREISLLDRVRIASPCPAAWPHMRGDERVRFCHLCQLNVYNLSAMSRPEAEELIRAKEGRMCVTYWQRADGTILTSDCRLKMRDVPRRVAGLGVSLVALLVLLICGGSWSPVQKAGASYPGVGLRYAEPFAKIYEWFTPQPLIRPAGGMALGTPISLPALSRPRGGMP